MLEQSRYPIQRRVGLSRNAKTASLLRGPIRKASSKPVQVNAPPLSDTESEPSEPEAPTNSQSIISHNPQRERSTTKRSKSSHFEEDRVQSNSQISIESSDSSESLRESKANIPQTYFGTSKKGKEQTAQAKKYATQHNAAGAASRETNSGPICYTGSQDSDTSTRTNKRKSFDDASINSFSNNKGAPTRKNNDRKEVKSLRGPNTYSLRNKQNNQQSNRLSGQPTGGSQDKTAVKLKKRGRPASPESSVLPLFKEYDDDPFDRLTDKVPPKQFTEFPYVPSSPEGTPPTFNRHSSLSPVKSPRHAVKTQLKHPSASPPGLLQNPKGKPSGVQDLDSGPISFSEDGKDEDDSITHLSDHSGLDYEMKTRCPMCCDIVDTALLESFSRGARLNIRKQIQFCRLHKKKSAEDAWRARDYPRIDWEGLGFRLAAHYDYLQDIINSGSSHYGSILVENVKDGKNRTLLKAEDSLTPGYYGPRGLRTMSENIIDNLSSILRARAVDDRLISSRGYSGYVEAVLVPELTVQLICEDMKVEMDEARRILEESRWIGDLIHEDAGDMIDRPDDDEHVGL